jgi:hypothetical protein
MTLKVWSVLYRTLLAILEMIQQHTLQDSGTVQPRRWTDEEA